ncbi:RTA1 like protein-domain-containing protein [Aspergillus bertholletiae]|uniref:RTA1 like protein-domain-containing protein n=1 Tax=Aspergillus bertholletiae TaxID=1226010 RepID=A0A5N7BKH9_9EURO|nr:RTA1 like protein-domain-containing protein [Aspergillus bertholletiae]
MASYNTCSEVSPLCPVEATTYGYYPNYGGNIFFTVFYGVCGLFQLGFGIYFRSWTLMVALVVGTFLEMAGYIGRVLMNKNPWDGGAFKLQIVAIILGPTFIAAGIYLTLKHIILSLGPEYSRLKPRLFTWIFIGCDIGSLILQAAGGGVAAAAGSEQRDLLNAGNDIIITGIAFQVATMSVCGLLALDFFLRYLRRGSGEKALTSGNARTSIILVVVADIFAYFTVLIRCIYRIPEMAGGWGNPLMQKEDEFLVLDGMMVALAVLALTVFHPGFFLPSLRRGSKNTEAA